MSAPALLPAPSREAFRGWESGENFPVAPGVLPSAARAHLRAVYDYARLVDQIGDAAAGDRLRLLDELEQDLERVYQGRARHAVLRRLQPTVTRFGIPPDPFQRLIEANRVDQRVTRYESFDDLLDYCRLSANPVGELVLRVMERATPDRIRLSDLACSALQVVEHLQDVVEDHRAGRIYLPLRDLGRFGVRERDLAPGRVGGALPSLIAFEANRAVSMLRASGALVRSLHGWRRLAVAGYVGGGLAACDGLRRAGFEVRTGRLGRPGALLTARFAIPLALGAAR